jgi:chemosensory pili system protein ChpE
LPQNASSGFVDQSSVQSFKVKRRVWGALCSALSGVVGTVPNGQQTTVFFAGVMSASILCCFITAALVDWLKRASAPR